MNTVEIKGSVREGLGKRATKNARNEGKIPCVLYGKEDLLHFETTLADIKSLIYTPDFKVAEVNLDGKITRAIVKDVQYHPVKENIMHIDFLQLVDGQSVKVELPIRFKGTSPGVKLGGKLQQSIRRVRVKGTPENLVDELYVDISHLELGQAARVRDIDIPEGLELLVPGASPVAVIEIPRALRSAEAAKAAEAKKGK